MKTQLPAFFTWLTVAALADWLISRTLARAAIFMPKTPAMLPAYSAVGISGQVATSLVGLLAMGALGWIAWQHFRRQRSLVLAVTCAALLLVSLLGLFVPSAGWLALSFQSLLCTGILLLVVQAWKRPLSMDAKIAISFTALALLVGSLYQGLDAAYAVLGLPGPPALSGLLFNAGELLVLLSVLALWWSFGRRAQWGVWLVAALPALAFVIPRLLAPAMTGIMAIWSTGLTMYLPWPAYVCALWLAGVTVIYTLRQGHATGWAILLLAAAGFAPQLSTQAFLGLIALWLLVSSASHALLVTPAESTYSSYPQTPFPLPDRASSSKVQS